MADPIIIPKKVSRLTQRMLGTNDRPIMWSEFASLLTQIESGMDEISQGGNSFGAAMVIGTNDANYISVVTNGVSRFRITDTGIQIGINPFMTYTRTLLDSTGIATVNWNTTILSDSSSVSSVKWGTRELVDAGDTVSLNWDSGFLYSTGLAGVTVNWNAANLQNPGAATPGIKVDWVNYIFRDDAGVTSLSWHGRSLLNSADVTTLNWENLQLINPAAATPGVKVDWQNYVLKDDNDVQIAYWGNGSMDIGGTNVGTARAMSVSSTTATVFIYAHNVSPETVITASEGALTYVTAAGAGALYLKYTGGGNTGWQSVVHTGNLTYKNDNTAAYVVVASDDLKVIGMTLNAARTFTLPAVAAVRAGFTITVMDEANTGAASNIDISSASAIIGDVQINTNGARRTYMSTGTKWILIGA